MAYEKYYPGGWQSGPAGGTPITPEALEHIEAGIENALPKDGTAEAAQKLATARGIRVNLESDAQASFDGSGDAAPGVTGVLPLSHGGTGAKDAASARANLGALSNAGDTGTGQYVFQQGYRVHSASGTGGAEGHVKVAQIKIEGTYVDRAIQLLVSQRGYPVSTLDIVFGSVGNTDPDLNKFYRTGVITAYLHKSATSTWDLYIQKSYGWDSIDILDIKKSNAYQNISVTWTEDLVSGVPSGGVWATNASGLHLLWENASPTSEFAAQTITLAHPYSNFDAVLMLFRIAKGNTWVMPVFLFPDEPSFCSAHVTNHVKRRVTANYGNMVTCYEATIATTYGEPVENNGYCIPYQIYGVRWRA